MIEFRQAAKSDAENLKCIARRVIRHNYVSFLGEESVNQFISSGMADKEIDDGIDDCTVMVFENDIIGFAITKENLLHLIMMDTSHQNKGYGSKLLDRVEKSLFKKFDTLALQTFKENSNTVQFYINKQWVITKEQAVPELGKTMLFFEKQQQ